MGHNDHIDMALLDDIDELLERGIIDAETDADLIGALTAIANEIATPEQQALYAKHIARLMTALEDERGIEHLEYLLGKDD